MQESDSPSIVLCPKQSGLVSAGSFYANKVFSLNPTWREINPPVFDLSVSTCGSHLFFKYTICVCTLSCLSLFCGWGGSLNVTICHSLHVECLRLVHAWHLDTIWFAWISHTPAIHPTSLLGTTDCDTYLLLAFTFHFLGCFMKGLEDTGEKLCNFLWIQFWLYHLETEFIQSCWVHLKNNAWKCSVVATLSIPGY